MTIKGGRHRQIVIGSAHFSEKWLSKGVLWLNLPLWLKNPFFLSYKQPGLAVLWKGKGPI